jgi:hypothetical protein
MTTQGEIEFKKSIQDPNPQIYNDNSIRVGGNFSGIANTGNNNTQSLNGNAKSEKPKWMQFSFYWEETIKAGYKWVLGVIVIALLSYLGCNLYKENKQDSNVKSQNSNKIIHATPDNKK